MLKMHCSSLSLPSLSSLSLFCVITLFYLVLLFRCKIVDEPSTTTDDLHSFQVSNVMKWRENAGDSNGKSFGIELTYAIRDVSTHSVCKSQKTYLIHITNTLLMCMY